MTKNDLLNILQLGARLHQSEHIEAAEYRADPTTTEYLLTAALLRAARKPYREVRVEALCTRVVNVMTSSSSTGTRKALGKMRFDLLLGGFLRPEAIVEVKIGVRSGNKLFDDCDKLLSVISHLDRVRNPVVSALVYETHLKGSGKIVTGNHFEALFNQVDTKVQADIRGHLAKRWPTVAVSFHLLAKEITHADVVDGIIEEDGSAAFISAAIFENQLGSADDFPLNLGN
jgi:hypothetical protein